MYIAVHVWYDSFYPIGIGREQKQINGFEFQELVGGKLYTCSRCSSSFHAICHFPPLPIKKTDRLQWLCHRCKIELKHNFDQPAKPILVSDLSKYCFLEHFFRILN